MSKSSVSVSYGVTLNLGNYESARLDATYTTDVPEGQSAEETYEVAWGVVAKQISDQAEGLKDSKG
jgi:hypothetical protein